MNTMNETLNTTTKKKSSGPLYFIDGLWDRLGMLLVLAILFILSSLFVDSFLTPVNVINLALAATTVGIVACAMLFCLASGNFDLSVASVIACAGVVSVAAANWSGSLLVGFLAGLGIGAAIGLLNGFVIAVLGINALITTLATMQIGRGLAYIVTQSTSIAPMDERFTLLGTNLWRVAREGGGMGFPGIPIPVLITILCFIVFGFLLKYTAYGRNTLAIGGSEEAARLAGVPVIRTKIVIFVVSALMSALVGIILAARMSLGDPKVALGLELNVISACVLGGVSLTGGVGKISYVIAGVLILALVENVMSLMNLDAFYQYVVRGTVLLIAVVFDRYKKGFG